MKTTILAPIFGAAMLASVASAGAAGAVTTETFNLTLDACSGGCFAPGGSAGTVTVTQNNGALDFVVTLAKSGSLYDDVNANGNSQHHALTFSVIDSADPSEAITISSLSPTSLLGKKGITLTPAFTASVVTNGSITQSGFDAGGKSPVDWNDSVDINASAVQGQTPNSFSFVVSDAKKDLTLKDLSPVDVTRIGAVYISADVIGNVYKGNTGNVGALMGTISTPEPASWALMLLGVGLTGVSLRARRRSALAHARV